MNDQAHLQRTAPRAIVCPPSPLAATVIDIAIDDLLATVTLEQRYVNNEAQAIEVAYTIALPLDAALLDVEVEIGGRTLRGLVQPRVQAELRYEQVLAEGHSAFSIRMVDDQLLNIALGNLKPGETLALRIVMAQWLDWNGDCVRLTLPTTIAPRYGASKLQMADRPVVDVLVEHGFKLNGRVRGLLARAELASATHRLAVRAAGDGLDFAIERGQLDRDIVIDLRDGAQALRVAGTVGRDLGGMDAAMISFCAHAATVNARPVVAELVVDCSGSMGGISIEQSRVAVRAIVGQLSPADRINVLRFGSSHAWLLRRPQPATLPVQNTMLQAADQLQADLGGTELMPALMAGLDDLARVPAEVGGERVLFIISDGEVWNLDTQEFLARCARERVRVFAVAVGSAAVEATFAPLTRATGGALERVLPGDAMAERIQRHFARVRSGALRQIEVRWPGATRWTRGPAEVYPGDGIRLGAGLGATTADTSAEVRWIETSGECCRADVPLRRQTAAADGAPSTLARMLARARLADITDAAAATELAVSYQLVTPHSAITLVLERAPEEQLDRLPELRQVPQMLAAGWGGSATDLAPVPAAPVSMAITGQFAAMAPPPPDSGADLDIAFCLDSSADAAAGIGPPTAAPGSSPASAKRVAAPRSRGIVHRVMDHFSTVFASTPGPTDKAGGTARAGQPVDQVRRRELIALLVARLSAQPALVALANRGELSLSALGLELPPPLFNWLDEQAEQQQLDLESSAFWRVLIDDCCALEAGLELRRLLGR